MDHCLDFIEATGMEDTEDTHVDIMDTAMAMAITVTTTTTTTTTTTITITIMVTITSGQLFLKQSQSSDFLALVIIIHVIITMDIIGDDRCLLPCAATDDLFIN